ncbi:iron-containing alcohol dehydrogenase [Desulfobacula sp.]|uniref:iron-containing alcohol dehydrogenase n=1 Tax=Desulfobacula sp. TaxID=2593537 RepID=UPI002714DABA|nr:iron-containing alcohol dehydrogenase [Desulfobacula sp.]
MNKPQKWSFDQIKNIARKNSQVWSTASVLTKVKKNFSCEIVLNSQELDKNIENLIVVGGGTLIDKAKVWRQENCPEAKLYAIPSIWGSGAENSPIAVLNKKNKKVIYNGLEFLPDVRGIWEELSGSLSNELIKFGSGDVWAHALEGFFSPLASESVLNLLSQLIKTLESLPVENNPIWYEYSAEASWLQSMSGVGFIHGISHILEGVIKENDQKLNIGHAQLCSIYLWPVFSLNIALSPKIEKLAFKYNLNLFGIMDVLKTFYDDELYDNLMPAFEKNFKSILRDPCTRINSALIRPDVLSYFTGKQFK